MRNLSYEKRLALSFSSINNGLATTKYTWDKDFASTYAANNSLSTSDFKKGAVSALQDYIAAGEGITKKYGPPFNLKKDSGDIALKKLTDDASSQIRAKMDLAHKTIDTLNN